MKLNCTMTATVATAMLLTAATRAAAADTARGVVYEDRNGNNVRDAGEPGIPGVAVSNQDVVVLTDEQGRYTLPVTDDTIIFVSKPAGHSLPVDKNRLPRFHYIHRPAGSPKLIYPGIAPTGPLPESVDFALIPAEPVERFEVILMADPQPETSQEVQYIRDDVLSEMVGSDAAFGITVGDIVSDRLELYEGYNAAVGRIGIPFFNVIGNHDMNFDAADDRDSDETFHRHYGPNYYSWNHGNVHFVALDDVEWLGPGKGNGNYRGALGERQLRWLANDLAVVPADRLIVLCMHIPLITPQRRGVRDVEALFDVVAGRERILALSGHTHLHEHMFYGPEQGWHHDGVFHELNAATVSGAWWSGPKDVTGIPVAPCRDGVPNGYCIVSFDGNTYTTRYKAAGESERCRMRIYPPGSTGVETESRTLIVNVFDGSPRCQVTFSLDEGPFREMVREPRVDPLAVAVLSGVLDSGKPWARPAVSNHIWTADVGEELSRGTHVVTVRVTDHFGRRRQQSRIFTR